MTAFYELLRVFGLYLIFSTSFDNIQRTYSIFIHTTNFCRTSSLNFGGLSRSGHRQHFHLPKPHPVYQALQLDKRGAIHIYGGLQKRSGQTDFVYSFELVARKRYSIISLLDLWGRFETQNYITVNILRRLDAYRVFHFV